jgi:hypothetical protein
MFLDPLSNEVQQRLFTKVNLVSRVVWPALATLVPAVATAAFKWSQEHTGKRRSVALTERICSLSKSIAELPEVSLSNSTTTPRAAMIAELESAVHELTAVQTKTHRRVASSVATTTAKIRSALLLYRPKGFAAWMLHLSFFAYLGIILLFFMGIMAPSDTPAPRTKLPSDSFTNAIMFLTAFGILGVPPLVIRYFAARIHRKQCAQLSLTGAGAVCPEPTSGVPVVS